MGRKSQTIKVTVHMSTNTEKVFNNISVEEFWVDKIISRLQKEHLTNENVNMFVHDVIKRQSLFFGIKK